ncbi:MAG TPA: aldehyde ferredoxin oxidoreductase C-terminal domain-containing protein, partial [Thermoleophilia bacterium]|nr:aldehyde ferredoxin oxidoreductase C-terminal domain-containing protein [Thermoleophilia bacterium]
VGGKGLGAHYLSTELPAGVDPLGPENILIFMTGPVSGVFPGTCRHAVVTKSPATGGFLDTYAGGFFAWELRKAGLLGIIIKGAAAKLSYLEVTADGATIRDATQFAGMSIADVDDDPLLKDYRVAAIGVAGENGVLMASIGNNAGSTKNGRSGFNGRGGSGAVMGSKNLKAIAVKGGKAPATSDAAKGVRKDLSKKIMAEGSASSWLADAGTSAIVDWTNGVNVLPTRNWHSGSFEDAAALVGHEAVIANLVAREGCYNCPVNCGTHVKAKEGAFPGVEADKLEYETIGLGATNTGNGDFSSIAKFARQCDELGIDTISCGAAVAFAMDAAEQGFIDHPIRFGDSEGQAALVEDIAHRRGIGAELARGIRLAAKAWGVDDSKVPVFEIKGLEFPAYDPRGSIGMALAYATADRGACHMRSWPIAADALSEDENADPFGPEGKAEFIAGEQDENCSEWSLVGCDFIVYDADDAATMLEAVGIEKSADEYRRMGTRIWNIVRLFNLRQGWTAEDDYVPQAIHNPLDDSGKALTAEAFALMKKEYYEVRGWDEAGRPTQATIDELGLGEYV